MAINIKEFHINELNPLIINTNGSIKYDYIIDVLIPEFLLIITSSFKY